MLKIVCITSVVLYFVGRRHSMWWVIFPGTVVHEFMHAIAGIILQARPTDFSVMPQKAIPGVPRVIGTVLFHNLHWFNTAPIALAPLFIIPVVLLEAQKLQFHNTWQSVTIAFLLANVLSQAIPSPTDIKIMKSRPWGVAFWVAVIAAVIYFNV